jgi:transposase
MLLGIDVSKSTLAAALWLPDKRRWYEREVDNDERGFARVLSWACERSGESASQCRVIMEATGVYHEAAALALHEAGCTVVIANPKRVRDYARGVGLLNKTDRVDARALARYGQACEEITVWVPPALEIRQLRALYARLSAVEEDLQRERNRDTQLRLTPQPQAVLDSLARSIQRLEQEYAALKQAIEDHYDQHPGLKAQRELLQSVPGIGSRSADRMLCLLKRHDFQSARQAAAFAGLVPLANDSGSSVHKPAHLSKQGDPQLRATLYMAAVVASRHNLQLRAQYQDLLRRGKAKMSALGALMRKLLHIAFGILKHETPYNPQLVAKGS